MGRMDIEELRDELLGRGLPIDGSRAVLIRRLNNDEKLVQIENDLDFNPPSPVPRRANLFEKAMEPVLF